MKYSAALVAVLAAGVVNAQFGMPECASGCIAKVIGDIAQTGCETTDFGCICGNDTFITTVGTCVRDACSPEDFQKTIDAAVILCKANGVDVNTNLPPASTTAPDMTESVTGTMTMQPTPTGNDTVGGGGAQNTTGAGPPAPTGVDDEGTATGLKAVGFGAAAGLVAAMLAL